MLLILLPLLRHTGVETINQRRGHRKRKVEGNKIKCKHVGKQALSHKSADMPSSRLTLISSFPTQGFKWNIVSSFVVAIPWVC
jgi:hypothetical protein